MSGPTVSVLISVYNGVNYLRRALDSVLAQETRPHEIIVIDDGSTDDTPNILKEYGSQIVVKRTANAGVAASRNEALRMATGNFVAFLDHDDRWFKNKLKKQLEAFDRYPEVGVVCCNFAVRHTHSGNRMMKHFSGLRHRDALNFNAPLAGDVFRHLIHEHFVGTTSTPLIRRDVVEKVGPFNPKYKSSQDFDYWLRCALVTKFLVLEDVLMYKKNHPQNISHNTLRTQQFHLQILLDTRRREAEASYQRKLEPVFAEAIKETYYTLGNVYYERGDIAQSFGHYWKAFTAQPTPANALLFLWKVSKKMIRLATFGLFSKKKLQRIGGGDPG